MARRKVEPSGWAELLSESLIETETVPPEWKTAEQLALEFNSHVRTVQRKIKTLRNTNRVEQRMFVIKTGLFPRPVMHYKLKGLPDKS